ncbi:MAG TPA: hypothetical protein ENF41_03205 [Candidatus Bathyarchaeota archaeon]|nr:hypothetical protein [Candidatus Bathyarchaeota archaeon]
MTYQQPYYTNPYKEARDYAYYAYLACLILGILIALAGLWGVIHALTWHWLWWVGAWWIWGFIELGIGIIGIFLAVSVLKPRVVTLIDQGRYNEAHYVLSNVMYMILAFIVGIIPGILWILTKQKLEQALGVVPGAPTPQPATPPPAPPPPA